MKKIIKEFKAFISRGNIIDLAVAVIIGGAFSAIVTSLVNDIVMPLITFALGKNSISDLSVVLRPESTRIDASGAQVIVAALTWNYGKFLQKIVDFFIIAICIFSAIKFLNCLKKRAEINKQKILELSERLKDGKLSDKEQKTLLKLESKEQSKATQTPQATQTSQDVKATQAPQDAQKPQDVKVTQTPQDAQTSQDVKVTQAPQDAQTPQDVKATQAPQDAQTQQNLMSSQTNTEKLLSEILELLKQKSK